MDNMLKMTKQQAIKAAYGQWYEECKPDENGWSTNVTMETLFFTGRSEVVLFPSKYVEKWRPESLSGIENNRGWTRIENEEDMPKEPGHYFVMDIFRTQPCIIVFEETLKKNWLEVVTHYQPIYTPQPPIF